MKAKWIQTKAEGNTYLRTWILKFDVSEQLAHDMDATTKLALGFVMNNKQKMMDQD